MRRRRRRGGGGLVCFLLTLRASFFVSLKRLHELGLHHPSTCTEDALPGCADLAHSGSIALTRDWCYWGGTTTGGKMGSRPLRDGAPPKPPQGDVQTFLTRVWDVLINASASTRAVKPDKAPDPRCLCEFTSVLSRAPGWHGVGVPTLTSQLLFNCSSRVFSACFSK